MKTIFAFAFFIALAATLVAGILRTVEKPAHQSHHFTALGDLPGGTFHSMPSGVSADGSVVVGYSNSEAGMEAFRWTKCGGMVGLGFPQAHAVSDDGSTVVGYRHIAGRAEPVCWTQHRGLQGLGNIAGCEHGQAYGASADGSVIVGSCEPPFVGEREIAFRLTPERRVARLEPLPNEVVETEAYAVSADGEVVVGALWHQSGRSAAFRWTSTSGFVDLGVLPGDTDSVAHAVSADGLVVVGRSASSAEAFRWTQQTGMVGLGMLPGDSCSNALGANADGSIIVGESGGEFGRQAFIWDAAHRMRSVRQLLTSATDRDASLRGWKLQSAIAVSRDGSVLIGVGRNPHGNREAWIARLDNQPSPETPAFRIAAR